MTWRWCAASTSIRAHWRTSCASSRPSASIRSRYGPSDRCQSSVSRSSPLAQALHSTVSPTAWQRNSTRFVAARSRQCRAQRYAAPLGTQGESLDETVSTPTVFAEAREPRQPTEGRAPPWPPEQELLRRHWPLTMRVQEPVESTPGGCAGERAAIRTPAPVGMARFSQLVSRFVSQICFLRTGRSCRPLRHSAAPPELSLSDHSSGWRASGLPRRLGRTTHFESGGGPARTVHGTCVAVGVGVGTLARPAITQGRIVSRIGADDVAVQCLVGCRE